MSSNDIEKEPTNMFPKTTPISFNNLDFVKCIFFSNKQYNIDKIHIPKNILYFEFDVRDATTSSIEKAIEAKIQEVYLKLNEDNPNPPIKVPYPFYLFISRVLEQDKSVFEGETFTHIPVGTSKIGTETVTTDGMCSLAIIDYIRSYLNSGIPGNKETETNKFDSSYYFNYSFLGTVKIFIYFPYLTHVYTYVANFADILISSNFIVSLIKSDYLLNFTRTSIINQEFIKKLEKSPVFTPPMINDIKQRIIDRDREKFSLYEDLVNLCYKGGCVSSIGEDLETMLYTYSTDDGKNADNALDKSPYMPSKCLSKTNGYLSNIRFAKEYNQDLPTLLKKEAIDEIKNTLTTYTKVMNMLNELNDLKAIDEEEDEKEAEKKDLSLQETMMMTIRKTTRKTEIEVKKKELDKYNKFMGESPVDLIISIAKKYKRDMYSDNENDKDREITIIKKDEEGNDQETKKKLKLSHYSKEYSKNIITELSYLNSLYPGVPEIVMSLYLYKSNYQTRFITYMPWKNVLITQKYVLNFQLVLNVGEELYSLSPNENVNYALTINKMGLIYVYDKRNNNVIYYLNRAVIPEPIGVIFTMNDISVSHLKTLADKSKIQGSTSVLNKTQIPSLINDEDPEVRNNLKNSPVFSITIDNDTGNLRIFGNKFYDSTATAFSSFIKQERGIVDTLDNKNVDFNNNQASNLGNLNAQQFFTYCSTTNNSCFQ